MGQELRFSCGLAIRSVCVLWLEKREMRLARGYDPSPAQSANFVGESAALDAEGVGKSLPIERYVVTISLDGRIINC